MTMEMQLLPEIYHGIRHTLWQMPPPIFDKNPPPPAELAAAREFFDSCDCEFTKFWYGRQHANPWFADLDQPETPPARKAR